MAAANMKQRNDLSHALWSRKGIWVSVFIFSCIINILMLTGSIYMMQVYDRVLPSGSIPTLIAISAIVLALYVFYGFLENVRMRLMQRRGRIIEETLRDKVFDATTLMALRKVPSSGGQPMQDLATIRQYFSGAGPLAFLDMWWVPIYFGIVWALHPLLGIAGVVAGVVIFILAMLSEYATRKPLQQSTMAASRAAAMNEEARRNAEALHALGMRASLRARWDKFQQEAMDANSQAADRGGFIANISRVIRMLVQSGILGLGAYLAVNHEFSAGSIIASSIIMSRGLAPIEQAIANWQQFLSCRKAMARIEQMLNAMPADTQRMKLPDPQGHLQVENLTVAVQGMEKPLLNNLSFKVEPGQGLGVIGPTGAGKSTLSRVLVGLTEPNRGTVRLDGATLEQRSEEDRGKAIGYLPQDVQLFDGTVAQNISRFAENPDPNGIVEAAKLANVHSLIMRLPKGYDTPLGENGARLSAGQRQRLALARAVYGNPVLIVMDEPNSNLDAEGEVALDAAIRASMARGAAVVIVAHRPSALQAVTDVLVLNEGSAAAYGKREEVFKQVTRPRAVVSNDGVQRPAATPTLVVPETRN
ncbi:MAG: type I secretion system permease/ATPase [Hyphomicrobiales bacterium]